MAKHFYVWALVLIAGVSAHRPMVKRQVPVLPDFIPVPPPPPLPPAPLIQLRLGAEDQFFPVSGAGPNRVPHGLSMASFVPAPPPGPPPGSSPQQMPLPPQERPPAPKQVPEKVAALSPLTQLNAPSQLSQNQLATPFSSQGRVANPQLSAPPPQPQFSSVPQQIQTQFSSPQQTQVQLSAPQQQTQPQLSAPQQPTQIQFALSAQTNPLQFSAPQQQAQSQFTVAPLQPAPVQFFTAPPQQNGPQPTPMTFPPQDPQGRAPTSQPPPDFSESTEQPVTLEPDEEQSIATELPIPPESLQARAPAIQLIPMPPTPAPTRAPGFLEAARRFFQLRPANTTPRPMILPPPPLPPPQQAIQTAQRLPSQQPIGQVPLKSGGMFTVQQPQLLQSITPVRPESPSMVPADQAQRNPAPTAATFESPSLLPLTGSARPGPPPPIPADQEQRQSFQRPTLTLVTPPMLVTPPTLPPTTPKPSRFGSLLPSLFTSSSNPPPQPQQSKPSGPEPTPRPGFFAGLFSRPTTPSPVAQQQQPVPATTPKPLQLPNILSPAGTLFSPNPPEQAIPATPSPAQPQLVIPPQQPVRQPPPMQPQQQQRPTSQFFVPSMIGAPSSITPTTYRPLHMISGSRGSY